MQIVEEDKIFCNRCKDYFDKEHFNNYKYNLQRGIKNTCKRNVSKGKKYDSLDLYPIDSYEYSRDMSLRRMYGISLLEYNQILKNQNNCCLICNSEYTEGKKFALDHCHNTLQNRAILCNTCNAAIGRLNDNIQLLKKAVSYLVTPTTTLHPNIIKGYPDNKLKRIKEKSLDIVTARKRRVLWKEYKISLQDYYDLLEKQSYCCAICGINEKELVVRLNVDHDHSTGNVRGMLCQSCNTGIGFLNDDVVLIEKAIKYLEKYVSL